MSGAAETVSPRRTALAELHDALGARMVAFAGWQMPVQYPGGILAEHRQCRTAAALFDVGHMTLLGIIGTRAIEAFSRLVPADLESLAPGRARYTVLLTDEGTIVDDLIVSRIDERELLVVANAARREADLERLATAVPADAIVHRCDQTLIAVQGPAAADVLARISPGTRELYFMEHAVFDLAVAGCRGRISRGGYTGEDGFEIMLPAVAARPLAEALLAEPAMAPAGLGARDALRLEAGLCLYGQELDLTRTPVQAGLLWTLSRKRLAAGDFAGAPRLVAELEAGPAQVRVGIALEGRQAARTGASVLDQHGSGVELGRVTSGVYSPALGHAVAQAYVDRSRSAPGTRVSVRVRDRALAATVAPLPFVPHRYRRRPRAA